MNARRYLVALVPLALLAARPTHGDNPGPKIEITMGILVQDTSCAQATHALLGVCDWYIGGRTPQIYLTFPGGKNVDRFLGRNVRLRGTMEFTGCAKPLMRVTSIGDSTAPLPPCPPPPCP